jgi:hypothetical protein
MTERTYRACALWHGGSPAIELFGKQYGVCPLMRECPANVTCGYERTAAERGSFGENANEQNGDGDV